MHEVRDNRTTCTRFSIIARHSRYRATFTTIVRYPVPFSLASVQRTCRNRALRKSQRNVQAFTKVITKRAGIHESHNETCRVPYDPEIGCSRLAFPFSRRHLHFKSVRAQPRAARAQRQPSGIGWDSSGFVSGGKTPPATSQPCGSSAAVCSLPTLAVPPPGCQHGGLPTPRSSVAAGSHAACSSSVFSGV
jgi:hypothetical protein